jgi:outer membrane protein assembly factor BamB
MNLAAGGQRVRQRQDKKTDSPSRLRGFFVAHQFKRRARPMTLLQESHAERLPMSLRKLQFAALCWFTAIAPAAATFASEWPEFRGPTGQGIAVDSNPPFEWTPEKNIAWRTSIPGSGWSSPIVFGKRIYLTTAVKEVSLSGHRSAPDVSNNEPTGRNSADAGLSLRALAIDAGSGKIVWDREVFHYALGQYQTGHAKNGFASPTPITNGEQIYVHFGPQGTAALDMEGNILWRNTDIKYDARHGAGGSPVIAGEALIFNCDGVENPFVVALDRKTGKELWRTSRLPMTFEKFAFSTPLVIPSSHTASGLQVISPGSHMIGSYDPDDGRELWHVYFEKRWSLVPRPVLADGMVLVCNGGEAPPELVAIRPDGSGDVTNTHVVWRHNKFAPLTSSVVAVNGMVFMVSDAGIAACTELATGKLVWKKRLGGNFSASPIAASGRVYFPNDNGVCYVLAAKAEFEQLAKNDLGEPILASFAVTGDALIIRTASTLYRVETKD